MSTEAVLRESVLTGSVLTHAAVLTAPRMSAVRVADSIIDDQLAGYRSGSVIRADMPDRRMVKQSASEQCSSS